LDFIKKLLLTFGVGVRRYGDDLSGLEDFDEGLRSRLFPKNDTAGLAGFLRDMEEGAMYLWGDAYGCRYCFFRLDGSCGDEGYCIIGPWREITSDDAAIDNILKRNRIPYHLRDELAQYIKRVPHFDWEAILFDCVSALYGEDRAVRIISRDTVFDVPAEQYSPEPDGTLSRRFIKERYKNEDAVLTAVSEGDADKALCGMACLETVHVRNWTENNLRNGKNYLIVFCTLLRKAVENGFVHPAHIDAASDDFMRRIEKVADLYEAKRLVDLMIRRYCALVKEFSLRDYSPFIRNVINHVDFNLGEALSVKFLANRFRVSPGNLSAQFRREKGMTLTGYINAKRLERAKSMLHGSGLYVQEIAERCGFLNINYFSRLFKQQFGVSPMEFRKKMVTLHNL
jgi:AraC-like DNA-binding protein